MERGGAVGGSPMYYDLAKNLLLDFFTTLAKNLLLDFPDQTNGNSLSLVDDGSVEQVDLFLDCQRNRVAEGRVDDDRKAEWWSSDRTARRGGTWGGGGEGRLRRNRPSLSFRRANEAVPDSEHECAAPRSHSHCLKVFDKCKSVSSEFSFAFALLIFCK